MYRRNTSLEDEEGNRYSRNSYYYKLDKHGNKTILIYDYLDEEYRDMHILGSRRYEYLRFDYEMADRVGID